MNGLLSGYVKLSPSVKLKLQEKAQWRSTVLLSFSLSYKYSTLIQHNINVVNWSDDGEY